MNSTGNLGVVGVLGGMGPLTTVEFMRKVIDATPATLDQDHVPVVISSVPQIPDRIAAFQGRGISPLPHLLSSGMRLVFGGAGVITIPCDTAHFWFDDLSRELDLPMLHMIDAAVEEATTLVGVGGVVGFLGNVSLRSNLYISHKSKHSTDLRWLTPTAHEVNLWIIPAILAAEARDIMGATKLFEKAALALAERGAQAIVLGGMEIPVRIRGATIPVPIVDALSALARRAVAWSLNQRHRSA